MAQSSAAAVYPRILPGGANNLAQVASNATGIAPAANPSGDIIDVRRISGFTFTERHYPGGLVLAKHYHEHAYLSLTLEGVYSEFNSAGTARCEPRTLRYLPAGEVHSNNFDANVRCLLIEIDPPIIQRLRGCSAALDRPGEISGFNAKWLASKLCREFRQGDEVSLVSLEGIALEILAEAARAADAGRILEAPRWLRKAREVVDSRFLAGVSLTEVASEAGVHAVHLSREFRKRFQCSVGEYMRKRRVEHACYLITNSELTLSEIAMTCGFADQSHFSKTFKRETGLTPAHFRTISAAS